MAGSLDVNESNLQTTEKPSDAHTLDETAPRTSVQKVPTNSDTLLDNLSPTKTLHALLSVSNSFAVNTENATNSTLIATLEQASSAERAFGFRVAETTQQLRHWVEELESWAWPGTFETPSNKQRSVKAAHHQETSIPAGGFESETNSTQSSLLNQFQDLREENQDVLYWGSLQAWQAQAYEARADQIQEQLDSLNVEELKEHVLDVHAPSRSRAGSTVGFEPSTIMGPEHLKHLDDFTALVTGTVLQALPYLSRLSRLLHVWSIRLAVLRRSSVFLSGLQNTQSALNDGWGFIAPERDFTPPSGALGHEMLNRNTFSAFKDQLQDRVTMLGQILDWILDELEGREDTVPDRWIDEFENLEAEYTQWVVTAGKRLLEIESRGIPAMHAEQSSDNLPAIDDSGAISHKPNLEHESLPGKDERDEKHDTLTEPFLLPLGKTDDKLNDRSGNLDRDDTLSASLSSDPPNQTLSDSYPAQVNELVSPDKISSSSNPVASNEENEQAKPEHAEPKTFISKPSVSATPPDDGRRKSLSAKINALMGKEEKAPVIRATKAPPAVRPFERANAGFGRLFSKSKDSSRESSLETSTSDRQIRHRKDPSPSGSTQPGLSGIHGSIAVEREDLGANETKESEKDAQSRNNADSERTDQYSPSTGSRLQSDLLRNDLSDIQRAADSFSPETEEPGSILQDSFGDRPQYKSNQSIFPQENWPLASPRTPTNELEETFAPNAPIATDYFHQMFVDSLPTSPNEGLASIPHNGHQLSTRPPVKKRHTIDDYTQLEVLNLGSTASSMIKAEDTSAVLNSLPQPRKGVDGMLARSHSAADATRMQSAAMERLSSLPTDFAEQRAEGTARQLVVEKPLRRQIFKRASLASIEAFPRSEVIFFPQVTAILI
jgi:hypothetical protein